MINFLNFIWRSTALVAGGAMVGLIAVPSAAQDGKSDEAPIPAELKTSKDPPPIRVAPVQGRVSAPAPPALRLPPPPAPPNWARPAVPRNQKQWASRFDYPRNLDVLGEEGVTEIWVQVLASGRASGCAVISSSGFNKLDQHACRAMVRYARFNPALDREGNPTVASYTTKVRWQTTSGKFKWRAITSDYPPEALKNGEEGTVGAVFDVDAAGKVVKCMISRSSGSAALDLATCNSIKRMQGSASTKPDSLSGGTRTVRRTVEWTLPEASETEADKEVVQEAPAVSITQPSRGRSSYKPMPIGDPRYWINNADYPLGSLRAGEDGRVEYELFVDETGKVTDCKVLRSTATSALDAWTCELLLERAKFEPGLNEDGKAVANTYFNDTFWNPDLEPEFPAAFTYRSTFLRNARGEMEGCEILEKSGTLSKSFERTIQSKPCPDSWSDRGVPYRDEDGAPVAKQVTVMVDVKVEDVPE